MMMSKPIARLALFLAAVATSHATHGQYPVDAQSAVRDIVVEAISRISDEDMAGFTDLMMDGGIIGAAGVRPGNDAYFAALRSRAVERETVIDADIVGRGFDIEVMVSGPVAMAWVPYDLYRDGEWSHCGVDVFSLLYTDAGWRIASLTYSVAQPPVCQAHPDGPPESTQ